MFGSTFNSVLFIRLISTTRTEKNINERMIFSSKELISFLICAEKRSTLEKVQ